MLGGNNQVMPVATVVPDGTAEYSAKADEYGRDLGAGATAPVAEAGMSRDGLGASLIEQAIPAGHSVSVRQVQNMGEILGAVFDVAYEANNKYVVSVLPEGFHAKTSQHDGTRQDLASIRNLPTALFAQERTSCIERMAWACLGLQAHRPFVMGFSAGSASGGDAFIFQRDFALGAPLCCPSTGRVLRVEDGATVPGPSPYYKERVDGQCCCRACLCNMLYDLHSPSGEHLYSLEANLCCFGRHNNCLGATPCFPDMIFPILDSSGMEVAHIQKTYGSEGLEGLGRCCMQLSTYIVTFPPNAPPEQRALILATLMELEITHFDKKPQSDN